MKNQNSKIENAIYRILIIVFISSIFTLHSGLLAMAVDETSTTTDPIVEPIPTEPTSTTSTITVAPENVTLNIRYQNTMFYSGQIPLVTTTYHDLKNDLYYDLSGTSTVFSTLINADSLSNQFSVSEATYNQGYDSYYLRCLTLGATSSTPTCDNWNYTVDGIYPGMGMDKYLLHGGETIYLYFSTPWQITATTSTFPLGTSTTLQTWRYQYDDLQNPWTLDGDDAVDISIINPNSTGWWDTNTTVSTTATGNDGSVDHLFSATGTFFAKITSPDYSKWSNPIAITVNDAPSLIEKSATSTTPELPTGASGSSDNITVSQNEINNTVKKILDYLQSQQDNDGKIIDGGITDWVIMSFAANGQYASDIKKNTKSLLDFATNYNFTDASDLNICASYPRHVLALLAAGVAKDDTQIQTMTKKIQSTECYQNNKFGLDGINDDVFALLALNTVDVPANEPIITDIINTITKDQTADGASTWGGWASADITGATVNALQYAKNKGAIVDGTFFEKAKNYLKQQQVTDGGWGDALSTSWALMGINSLNQTQTQWINSTGKNPWSSMTASLKNEGYYDSSWSPGIVDWFATKHAVPALLGKFWPIILTPKSISPVSAGGGNSNSTETATTTPVSIVAVSTTSTLLAKISPNLDKFLTPSSTELITKTETKKPVTELTTLPSDSIKTEKIESETKNYQPKIKSNQVEITRITPMETISTTSQPITEIFDNTEFRPVTTSTSKVAKDIFGGSVALAGSLGLYLGWRLLQSLV